MFSESDNSSAAGDSLLTGEPANMATVTATLVAAGQWFSQRIHLVAAGRVKMTSGEENIERTTSRLRAIVSGAKCAAVTSLPSIPDWD